MTSTPRPDRPRTAVLVAFPGVCTLDVAGPAEVLGTASRIAGHLLYDLVVAAPSAGILRDENGLGLVADIAIDDVERCDLVVVAGGDGVFAAAADDAVVASVRRLAGVSAHVTSVCTGAFLLAATGMLDHRRVTTHWAFADRLASSHASLDVVADELFVEDGPVTTAAGVAAGIDLALHLVQDHHGHALARRVSRRMVVYLDRKGGQSQFSERLAVEDESVSPPVEAVLAAVRDDPTRDCSTAALASIAGMSERHLRRVFSADTGTTPARLVERIRVDVARTHLERSDWTMERVAASVGFGSPSTMRQVFNRVLGSSPSDYRQVHRTVGSGE